MIKAIWRWLVDYPRPTWIVNAYYGKHTLTSRRVAENMAFENNRDGGEACDTSYVRRGPWMRPSEIAALREH